MNVTDLALVDTEQLDVEALALVDPVLLATGRDHCIHRGSTLPDLPDTGRVQPGGAAGQLRAR